MKILHLTSFQGLQKLILYPCGWSDQTAKATAVNALVRAYERLDLDNARGDVVGDDLWYKRMLPALELAGMVEMKPEWEDFDFIVPEGITGCRWD